MKSTHHTAWAYTKGTAAALAMVTGTALLIAACSTVKAPPKEFTQDLLNQRHSKESPQIETCGLSF